MPDLLCRPLYLLLIVRPNDHDMLYRGHTPRSSSGLFLTLVIITVSSHFPCVSHLSPYLSLPFVIEYL